MSQRKGFLIGVLVGATLGALIALAASGAFSDTNQAADQTASPATSTVGNTPDGISPQPQSPADDIQNPDSPIPTRGDATTLFTNGRGVHTSSGIRLTGAGGATAFAVGGALVYQIDEPSSPLFVDRGAGADILASSDNVEIRLLSVGMRDDIALAVVLLIEPAVVEGINTTTETLATVNVITGEIETYGVVAGFETVLESASIGPDGFVLGVVAEGDAFLLTVGWDSREGEIIIPCFGGTCPRTPWTSSDGSLIAYLSGESNIVVYDLGSDRVFADVDLGPAVAIPNGFSEWRVTDFNGVEVVVSNIGVSDDGTAVYGNAVIVTLGGEVTLYEDPGIVTFVR